MQVSFDRFEGVTPDRQVVLSARWSLWGADGRLRARGDKTLIEPWPGAEPGALLAALDRALARFGADLATAVAAAGIGR